MAAQRGRIEDFRLLKGQGRFVAGALPEGCLHAAFLRADRASARIARLDAAQARLLHGVALVLTGADLAAAGNAALPPEQAPDNGGAPLPGIPLLCGAEVRHLGEPLVLIVAESPSAALDAAEAVELDLEDLPIETGIAFRTRRGDAEATRAALAASAHRVTVDVRIPRLSAAPLETRGAVAIPDGEGLVFHTSTQNPFAIRRGLAALFGWPEARLQVLAPDVGGSFGLKGVLTREEALVAHAARLLGRPVAWLASRTEAFLADHQGRGVTARVTLGLDAELRFTAVEAAFEVDVGAYLGRGAFGLVHNSAGITGPYRIPVAAAEITGRLSPRAPLAPYRGNGRPEATLAIEQAVDAAARALGTDPLELRCRNLLGPGELPHRTALGFPIDCGDFPRVLETAARGADPDVRAARRQAAEARGRLYGFGLAMAVESAAGPVRGPKPDRARVTALAGGRVRLAAGVMSAGQGHETALTRMAVGALGLPPERFDYVNGDTEATEDGRGSGGSSGL
ncbi:MAG: xanthine dehydrogenase family protein molybdopterin-binding subunit, partial [Paracoccaceae bacterium]|nr:xanthine dehydrogenase family protein molybdopterin-binding subunit [Paracoccaceae bacterium]